MSSFRMFQVFNCPANLASHRRWHKPRTGNSIGSTKKSMDLIQSTSTTAKTAPIRQATHFGVLASGNDESSDGRFTCKECGKVFRRFGKCLIQIEACKNNKIILCLLFRLAYLKKHLAVHQLALSHISATLSSNPQSQPPPLSMLDHNRQQHPTVDATGRLVYQNHPFAFRQYYPNGRNPTLFPELDKRHFNALQEFYFQQSERMSAFRYAKQQELDAYLKRCD